MEMTLIISLNEVRNGSKKFCSKRRSKAEFLPLILPVSAGSDEQEAEIVVKADSADMPSESITRQLKPAFLFSVVAQYAGKHVIELLQLSQLLFFLRARTLDVTRCQIIHDESLPVKSTDGLLKAEGDGLVPTHATLQIVRSVVGY